MKQSLSGWDGRWRSPAFWFATGLGSGLLRPAPGTWGSLLGIVTGYGLISAGFSIGWFTALTVAVSGAGIISVNRIEKAAGVHDAPEIVIDEIAGQWIALFPFFFFPANPLLLLFAFGLFRLLDILKPWPIGWLDRKINGGFGVMIDDIVAGILTSIGIGIFLLFVMQ